MPQGVARIGPGGIDPVGALATERSVSWFAAVSDGMMVAITQTQSPDRTSVAIRCAYGAPTPIAVGRNVTLPILSSPEATVEGARYESNAPHHRIAPGWKKYSAFPVCGNVAFGVDDGLAESGVGVGVMTTTVGSRGRAVVEATKIAATTAVTSERPMTTERRGVFSTNWTALSES